MCWLTRYVRITVRDHEMRNFQKAYLMMTKYFSFSHEKNPNNDNLLHELTLDFAHSIKQTEYILLV